MTMSERILTVLGESPLPMRTPDLVAIVATGLTWPRQRVWVSLRQLLAAGLVVRELRRSRLDRGRGANQTVACWRLV